MSPHKLRIPSSTGVNRIDPKKPAKPVLHTADTRELKYGDVIQFRGHLGVWDEDSIPEDVVLRWRKEGDPLCDGATAELASIDNANTGLDLLAKVENFVKESKDPGSATAAFWDDVNKLPPEDLRMTDEEFERARSLYLDNSVQMAQAVLFYALGGGFASPRIVRTLEAVSYLVPSKAGPVSTASSDRTYRRLLETLQFVLDVMRCSSPGQDDGTKGAAHLTPGGEGWKSCIRVRLLHGTVRAKVQAKTDWKADQLPDPEDCPVSQEDMSATLAGFSTIPLWTLAALGLTASHEDATAFLALWRHVGFYMGVSPTILRRYWNTPQVADQFLTSMFVHIYAPLRRDDDGLFTGPTMPILIATSDRAPNYSSLRWNCAVTHHLLGNQLATYLKVPEPTWTMKTYVQLALIAQSVPVWFSSIYGKHLRRGWLRKRRWAFAGLQAMTLRKGLGNRRTKFRPGGQVDTLQWEDERIPDTEIVDKDKAVKVAFWEVLGEMIAVLAGIGGTAMSIGLLSLWKAYPFMARYYFRLLTH